jgi:hypothetical protein
MARQRATVLRFYSMALFLKANGKTQSSLRENASSQIAKSTTESGTKASLRAMELKSGLMAAATKVNGSKESLLEKV